MKILLIVHHYLDPNAGASGVTLQLGQHYQQLGCEVQYYSFDNLPKWIAGKVRAIVFPWFVAVHISNLCKKQAVDVIDASTGDAWVWATMLQQLHKNPPLLVTRSHGLEHTRHLQIIESFQRGELKLSWKYPLYHGGFRLFEIKQSLRFADLALFLNQADAKFAIETLKIDRAKVKVVRNGIPPKFLNLPFESILEDQTTKIRIAQIGSYIPRKGIQYGTPALNSILNRYPQIEVSFFGTGCPVDRVYQDFAPSIRDRVSVVPSYNHEDLPQLLKGHQIKLFPTLSEGFSLSLIEAMACGLVPVTTRTHGSQEIIEDGHNGILISPKNSQMIELALERLILDHSSLENLRKNAYTTAQRFSWECIAQEEFSLYEKVYAEKMPLSSFKVKGEN